MQDIKIKDQTPHCSKHVLPLVVGGLTITREDNMQLMSRYPDKYFDLAIVDPPYGIGKNLMTASENTNAMKKFSLTKFRKSFNDKDWDKLPNSEYWQELMRVSKNWIVWGGNYMSDYLPPSKHIIIWDKMTYIPTMSQFEFAFSSLNKHPQMVKINSNDKDRIHPTQKPVQLYKWILKNYAQEGFKIIDTHLGSGSHAIAIEEMNRFENMNLTLTACEIDEEYFKYTTNRIINHVAQQSLF